MVIWIKFFPWSGRRANWERILSKLIRGLMGREAASAFGRWFVLEDFPVQVELVAVCDLQEKLLEWFRRIPTVKLLTKDHQELLRSNEVDVIYVAVPHHLHEKMYLDVLA